MAYFLIWHEKKLGTVIRSNGEDGLRSVVLACLIEIAGILVSRLY